MYNCLHKLHMFTGEIRILNHQLSYFNAVQREIIGSKIQNTVNRKRFPFDVGTKRKRKVAGDLESWKCSQHFHYHKLSLLLEKILYGQDTLPLVSVTAQGHKKAKQFRSLHVGNILFMAVVQRC